MFSSQILNYIPAQIYSTKSGIYVGYYVKDLTTNKMKRIRLKVNRIKNKQQRLKYARSIVIEINRKLSKNFTNVLASQV